MNSPAGVPDAWDDDWTGAQNDSDVGLENTKPAKKPTKAERRQQQLDFNKKLWEEAETPGLPYFVQRQNDVPLQSGYVPNVKVLSRRPQIVKGVASRNPPGESGFSGTQADDGDESDEKTASQAITAEERAARARKELEEKQRKYDEARQKIFGSQPGSGTNSPSASSVGSNKARPRQTNSGFYGESDRGRARGRGGAVGMRGSPRPLYDPSAPKGGSASSSGRSTPIEAAPIRMPRGPDGSGKDGRGFLHRGGRGSGY